MDKHPIDEWQEEASQAQVKFVEQCLKDTSLVFQVFRSDAGRALIKRWTDILINQPTASVGDEMLSIGMNEGYKNFIRAIINAVKIHEDQS